MFLLEGLSSYTSFVPTLTPPWSDEMLFFWRASVTGLVAYVAIFLRRRMPRLAEQACTRLQRNTIEALATAINAKDHLTFDHVRRVQIYAVGLGRLVGCSAPELEALQEGALLHDVGKIGVPDAILTKTGKLTAEEFETMKMHPVLGADILTRINFPFPLVPVVRHHHERWDGTGYPDGLKGVDIPVTARILSIVDCFDAVREDRPYRRGMTRQEAIDLVLDGSGTLYDPSLVGLFLTHLPEFEAQIKAERSFNSSDFGIGPPSGISASGRRAMPAAGLAAT